MESVQYETERPVFLEYSKCEVMKENVAITDQIFQDLKDMRKLQLQKRNLTRERFDILENSHPRRFQLFQDRLDIDLSFKPQLDQRLTWERRKDLIEQVVFKVGQFIKAQEDYVNTAVDTVQRYIGDYFSSSLQN